MALDQEQITEEETDSGNGRGGERWPDRGKRMGTLVKMLSQGCSGAESYSTGVKVLALNVIEPSTISNAIHGPLSTSRSDF